MTHWSLPDNDNITLDRLPALSIFVYIGLLGATQTYRIQYAYVYGQAVYYSHMDT